MSTRLDIRKTYKLFIGGSFVRSESGRYLPARSTRGDLLDNFSQASRKDLREAVTAARSAAKSWAGKSAYLRGQILYRAAEMLQNRADELAREIRRSTDTDPSAAQAEVAAAIDLLVYFAGWTDKFAQVFGNVNPVASPHFNFSLPEPTGVVGIVAPDQPSLLALAGLLAPVILSGNSAVVLASESFPLPTATFSEVLATSDIPPGVINILLGLRGELAPQLAAHMDVNAIVDGSRDAAISAKLQAGTAVNLKRYSHRPLTPEAWLTEKALDPLVILETVEVKTAWHPIGF